MLRRGSDSGRQPRQHPGEQVRVLGAGQREASVGTVGAEDEGGHRGDPPFRGFPEVGSDVMHTAVGVEGTAHCAGIQPGRAGALEQHGALPDVTAVGEIRLHELRFDRQRALGRGPFAERGGQRDHPVGVEGVGPQRPVEVELPSDFGCDLGHLGDELGCTLIAAELRCVRLGQRSGIRRRARIELEGARHHGHPGEVTPGRLVGRQPRREATVTDGAPGADHVGPDVDTHPTTIPQPSHTAFFPVNSFQSGRIRPTVWAVRTRSSLATAERVRGAVLAGAVGDAIGTQVEFSTSEEIRGRFGRSGLTGMAAVEFPAGSIGDDTQLTLFTLEALVRGFQQWEDEAHCPRVDMALASYGRWLDTQGEIPSGIPVAAYLDGWMVHEPALRVRRSPSVGCLAALRTGRRGTPDAPINSSSGTAPLGRVGVLGLALDDPLHIATQNAALTHGHRDAVWAAGALALIVRAVADGEQIAEAAEAVVATLEREHDARTVAASLRNAVRVARAGPPTAERLAQLGSGWEAPEALAYAVCCSLAAEDGIAALQAAVNHSGPSDTIATACGHIVGTGLGANWIPAAWIDALDARDLIETVVEDVVTRCIDYLPVDRGRYPAHRYDDIVDAGAPTT